MFPKNYETLLLSKCANCSINFGESIQKATKLRFVAPDNPLRVEELSNVQVLSYIYGISTVQLTSNLTNSLQNVIPEVDYFNVLSALQDSYLADQISSKICLPLCELCATKLTDLYVSYKNFIDSSSADSFVSKATRDPNIQILQNSAIVISENPKYPVLTSLLGNSEEEIDIPNTECCQNYEDELIPLPVDEHDVKSSLILGLESNQFSCEEQQIEKIDELPENVPASSKNSKSQKKKKPNEAVPLYPRTMYCEPCELQFTSFFAIYLHKAEVHENQQFAILKQHVKGPPFLCPITPCDKIYKNTLGLKSHCARIHKVKLLGRHDSEHTSFCQICRYTFLSKQSLNLHRFRVHSKARKFFQCREPVKCSRCEEYFESMEKLQTHGLNVHLPQIQIENFEISENTKLRCIHCGLVFTESVELNIHENLMHGPEVKQVIEVEVMTLDNILEDDGTNDFAESTSETNLQKNSSNNCGNDSSENNSGKLEPTAASLIHKVYFTEKLRKEKLQQDISNKDCLTHSEIIYGPPYNCPKCPKFFLKLESLKKHCRKHHMLLLPAQRTFRSVTKNVSCLICSVTFSNMTGLKNHSRMLHDLPFVCYTCIKAFATKTLQDAHECEIM